MSARRGESGLSGILLVDKPSCPTSHDVVDRVRRATGERRVGHAGTLDPLATGLLVVLVGPATRLAPYLTAAEKTYLARIAFGSETDTDDAEGKVTGTAEVPARLLDAAEASEIVARLVGTHQQVPPAHSALKVEGTAAYTAARRGEPLDLASRTVQIIAARLVEIATSPVTWDIELSVSKGTYVRAIARDLGRSLGTAAHLSALRRIGSGTLNVRDAVPLSEIEDAGSPEMVAARFADPLSALGLPPVVLTAEGAARVSNGAALTVAEHCETPCAPSGEVALAYEGVLLAVYAVDEGVLRPRVVIAGGARGGER